MKIDIAICTWNRADLLSATLESMGRMTIPGGVQGRIIVVNNNSTDRTVDCVREFEKRLTDAEDLARLGVTLVNEPQQGHTFSRNRAVSLANGDLMLWTDDDVVVDKNWLTAYVNASQKTEESFWGGKISPKFPAGQPDWIAENWDSLKGCFAERDLGNDQVSLTMARLPYGANFAIRTEVQKRFLYDVGLGRRENSVLGEDEIDLFRRLLDAGLHGSWVPDSSLDHVIDQTRATEKYVHNYFVGQGKALVEKGDPWPISRRKLGWQRIYEFAAYRFKRQWAASPAWVAHLIRSGLADGQYQAFKSVQN